MPFFRSSRWASAFEKAEQYTPFGSREQTEQPFDKSKFEALTEA
jgi:hypothetical protein